ncbi:hypothetical protein POJ06DRAFT_25335 [Lipomyces tetrasporus]|uniref:DOD-type homing endonuclease domain-containing protein n=1 Tax=Lipomyces tetrasporus TaxID=54092 RepID=A0AAD7QN37_9ASCO|nr:uncharacterized protein POJ06DRAFT_25335 [Lipomyces tetrasporus]KAJ8097926.1 hypothetical protein POJ06DRAFT_25335 [Lipomyces tetrasporus]
MLLSSTWHQRLQNAAGTAVSGYLRNHDVLRYRIACPQGGRYARNPVLDGLRKLGLLYDKSGGIPPAYMKELRLLNNKSGGIPSSYMTADEDTRLAVIGGLIDSDGSYSKRYNNYKFIQSTEGHRKIVYDLKELASSCGISVTGVHLEMRKPEFGAESTFKPAYIYLGKGSVKFQKL